MALTKLEKHISEADVEIRNISEIEPMVFPTGRKTRVMIGQNGLVKGEKFCQGFVEMEKGGSIPLHDHETVESYTILKGRGLLTVDGEEREVKEGDYVFISSSEKHSLMNIGEDKLLLMFVYAPSIIVDHWAKELEKGKKD